MDASVAAVDEDLSLREARMRDEIRTLQEERARALLEEIDALQKEKRLAVAKFQAVQAELTLLRKENERLKRDGGPNAAANLVAKLARLEEATQRDETTKRELRDKLKTSTQHNARLMLKIKKLEQPDEGGGSSSNSSATAQRRYSIDSASRSVQAGSSGVAAPSPPVQIRYKVPDNVREALGEAKQTIGDLRRQLEDRENELERCQSRCAETAQVYADAMAQAQMKDELLGEERQRRKTLKRSYHNLKAKLKALQADSAGLRAEFEEFRSWSRRHLKALSDDMELCRAIYSLKNSLAQEQSTMEQMESKLKKGQEEVIKANTENERLAGLVAKLKKDKEDARQHIRSLSEQLQSAVQSKDTALLLLHQAQEERQVNRRISPSPSSSSSLTYED
ncbi:uncharacterized protein [Oscarella lobularis]|uniref:uncharacterized protein n=1 Tax=Oscarella lobularis TaxID=121494 RepID=UPI003313CD76